MASKFAVSTVATPPPGAPSGVLLAPGSSSSASAGPAGAAASSAGGNGEARSRDSAAAAAAGAAAAAATPTTAASASTTTTTVSNAAAAVAGAVGRGSRDALFQETVMHLAESLGALQTPPPWSKVNRLLTLCPTMPSPGSGSSSGAAGTGLVMPTPTLVSYGPSSPIVTPSASGSAAVSTSSNSQFGLAPSTTGADGSEQQQAPPVVAFVADPDPSVSSVPASGATTTEPSTPGVAASMAASLVAGTAAASPAALAFAAPSADWHARSRAADIWATLAPALPTVTDRNQCAVLALGKYFVTSAGAYPTQILPYLFQLLHHLPFLSYSTSNAVSPAALAVLSGALASFGVASVKASVASALSAAGTSSPGAAAAAAASDHSDNPVDLADATTALPAEHFAFSLVTMLLGIARELPSSAEAIRVAIVETLELCGFWLAQENTHAADDAAKQVVDVPARLCRVVIPTTIGLARAISLFSGQQLPSLLLSSSGRGDTAATLRSVAGSSVTTTTVSQGSSTTTSDSAAQRAVIPWTVAHARRITQAVLVLTKSDNISRLEAVLLTVKARDLDFGADLHRAIVPALHVWLRALLASVLDCDREIDSIAQHALPVQPEASRPRTSSAPFGLTRMQEDKPRPSAITTESGQVIMSGYEGVHFPASASLTSEGAHLAAGSQPASYEASLLLSALEQNGRPAFLGDIFQSALRCLEHSSAVLNSIVSESGATGAGSSSISTSTSTSNAANGANAVGTPTTSTGPTIQLLALNVDLLVASATTNEQFDRAFSVLRDELKVEESDVDWAFIPVYVACLRGLGELGRRRPRQLSPRVLDVLRQFVTQPSVLLLKLAHDDLLNAAARAVCQVLRLGPAMHQDLAEAFIGPLANRLYSGDDVATPSASITAGPDETALLASASGFSQADASHQHYSVSFHVSRFVVIMLAHIAVAMHDRKITKSVLSILMQKVGQPPSELDSLIIEQLGRVAVGQPQHALRPIVELFLQISGDSVRLALAPANARTSLISNTLSVSPSAQSGGQPSPGSPGSLPFSPSGTSGLSNITANASTVNSLYGLTHEPSLHTSALDLSLVALMSQNPTGAGTLPTIPSGASVGSTTTTGSATLAVPGSGPSAAPSTATSSLAQTAVTRAAAAVAAAAAAAAASSNRSSSAGDIQAAYRHCTPAITASFLHMAQTLENVAALEDLFLRVCELFIKLGMSVQQSNSSKVKVQASSVAGNLGFLLPVLSELVKRVPPVINASSRAVRLFRDLWFYLVTFGFVTEGMWLPEWFDAVTRLSAKSPVLVTSASGSSFAEELELDSAIRRKNVSSEEQQELRSALSLLLNSTPLNAQIAKLTPAQCTYLMAVYHLETLRVHTGSFRQIFRYLEDKGIERAGLSGLVRAIANEVFHRYLNSMADREKSFERESDLESHIVFLLVNFNNVNKVVKRAADEYLTELVNAFPHLSHNAKALQVMFDLIDLLARTLDQEGDQRLPYYTAIPGTSSSLLIPGDHEAREMMVQDFTSRVQDLLKFAMQVSPLEMQALLQQYLSQSAAQDVVAEAAEAHVDSSTMPNGRQMDYAFASADRGNLSSAHAGRSLATQYASFGLNASATSLPSDLARNRPDCAKSIASVFVTQLELRNHYAGEVAGILSSLGPAAAATGPRSSTSSAAQIPATEGTDADGTVSGFVDRLKRALHVCIEIAKTKGPEHVDFGSLRANLYRLTAFIISQSNSFHHELVHLVCWAPVYVFSEKAMSVGAFCWSWIVAARPTLEESVLRELTLAWDWTLEKRMGLFCTSLRAANPLFTPMSSNTKQTSAGTALLPAIASAAAAVKKILPPTSEPSHPNKTDAGPHKVWMRFFSERFEVIRHKSQVQIDLYASMIHRTLADPTHLSVHVSCTGVVYRVLLLALRLAQGTHIRSLLSRYLLRERVYHAALAWFRVEPSWPNGNSPSIIRENLADIIAFTRAMRADRRYFKSLEPLLSDALAGGVGATAAIARSAAAGAAVDAAMMKRTGQVKGNTLTRADIELMLPALSRGAMNTIAISSSMSVMSKESKRSRAVSSDYTVGPWDGYMTVSSSLMSGGAAAAAASNEGLLDPESATTAGSSSTATRPLSNAGALDDAGQLLMKDLRRRRVLIMLLLQNQIERLGVWHNPHDLPGLVLEGEREVVGGAATATAGVNTAGAAAAAPGAPAAPGEDEAAGGANKVISDRMWKDHVRMAWQANPHIAVQMVARFSQSEALRREVERRVRLDPLAVSGLPEALPLLVTDSAIRSDIPEMSHVLCWAPVSPAGALALFSKLYSPHPVVAQFALRVLRSFPADLILFYIPQLVQALRYDRLGYVAEYLLLAAQSSQLIAHQLIWNMRTNMYVDEEAEHLDTLAPELDTIIGKIVSSLSGHALKFYQREFSFFGRVTAISGTMKKAVPVFKTDEDKAARKKVCLEELAKIVAESGVYLPSNPEATVVGIKYSSGTPMQSAAKAPYLATFLVKKCSVAEIEAFDDEAELSPHVTEGADIVAQSCLFKVGDDVRQDMLALQVIGLFKKIFEQCGLDLYVFPYRVVATSPGAGVIEVVPNTKSRDQLGRQTEVTLHDYFVATYGDPHSVEFERARACFIKSMAAYSVISFLLQFKDRHNGNLLIDKDGHIIHIDFGFMFQSSPGGNMGFEPDLKLTQEMVDIMGGDMEAAPFKWFVELCVRAYLAVRPYHESVIALVALMLDTGLPCFREMDLEVLRRLRTRFQPDKTEREAASFMIKTVKNSYLNTRTKLYDILQYMQNGIPY
ncbi:type 3 phosphatidylinositol 4-kinase [Capsaspora owczarzaki ATCC 30864]|uniref:1-phosphatidylinositol 4-kinase n=1 Tax=Capsaspora owczarzaki (strain ATCC 30864) TaxID=595528 RepID=A0A0D2VGE8_CAPO3|nr:type 3 phosphatidylinositol 4-kinase [Capsaspora owczarzaki ATCC 30864]KJE88947.1 type 3 phosphatidylinositol 4-kinase [Capsaspora owczarzaki ATCC 30864]|eukprot:XP_004365385.2 type 3 phosphatidylinositol 4-kinase [Capsaspora owczarzaki ATCC 30864]